jgi:hypothetical protein
MWPTAKHDLLVTMIAIVYQRQENHQSARMSSRLSFSYEKREERSMSIVCCLSLPPVRCLLIICPFFSLFISKSELMCLHWPYYSTHLPRISDSEAFDTFSENTAIIIRTIHHTTSHMQPGNGSHRRITRKLCYLQNVRSVNILFI